MIDPNLPIPGAFPIDDAQTRFTVWAPKHDTLALHLPQLDRTLPMQRDEHGYFTLTTKAPAGTHYQFQLPSGHNRPDPASRAQVGTVHGPSIVTPQPRTPLPFLNPDLRHHIIYELHVGTFTPDGTFDAVIPRLSQLRDLGVTAIELMPVAQFPGNRNWGYDGVLPFAAHPAYGGLPGLLRLIDAAHAHHIAVILDVVYNHMGPEGNYLADFGPYYTDAYKTPWGAALNFDGPHSDHVREYFIQNSLFWTRDCGVDGLRLDAVHAILDHTASPFLAELTARNHAAAEAQGRRVLIIAESNENDPRLLRPLALNGFGMDGCWNDDYHHTIRAALTGERRGYYSAFGSPSQIADTINNRFAFTGQYTSGFQRRHGAPARDIDHAALIAFTQNHDQVGNRPFGDRLDASTGDDGARVAAALVLLSPFTPLLWMGEEYAESAPFQYFVSHTDPDLIEAVRRGRASEFAAFQDEPGGQSKPIPDPQSEDTFNRSKLDWSHRDRAPHLLRLTYYRELLRLRRELNIPSLSASVEARSIGPVIGIRYNPPFPSTPYALLANTSAKPAPCAFDGFLPPLDQCTTLLDSRDTRWGGDHNASAPASKPTPPTATLGPTPPLLIRFGASA